MDKQTDEVPGGSFAHLSTEEFFFGSVLHDIKHIFRPMALYRTINPNAQTGIAVVKLLFYHAVAVAVFGFKFVFQQITAGFNAGVMIEGYILDIMVFSFLMGILMLVFCLPVKLFTAVFGGERNFGKIAQGMAAYSITIIIAAVVSLAGDNVPLIFAAILYIAYFQYAFFTAHLKSSKIASGILVFILLFINAVNFGFPAYNRNRNKFATQRQATQSETSNNQLANPQKKTLRNIFAVPKETGKK